MPYVCVLTCAHTMQMSLWTDSSLHVSVTYRKLSLSILTPTLRSVRYVTDRSTANPCTSHQHRVRANRDARGTAISDSLEKVQCMMSPWVSTPVLVVLAVALEPPVRLVVIPFTPQSSDRPWVITSYEAPGMGLDGTSTIYFGNNDVHYVYLSRGHRIGSPD